MTRRPTTRRRLLGALGLLVALVAGPVGTVPVAASDDGCVPLVVDPGPLGGGTGARCVDVPPGATGLDVLRAGGHSVRLDGSGLVCAIDERPATGCGEATDGGYAYWSYWWRTDDSAWRYASRGPAAPLVPPEGGQAQAQGWAWNDGSGGQESVAPPDVDVSTSTTAEESTGVPDPGADVDPAPLARAQDLPGPPAVPLLGAIAALALLVIAAVVARRRGDGAPGGEAER